MHDSPNKITPTALLTVCPSAAATQAHEALLRHDGDNHHDRVGGRHHHRTDIAVQVLPAEQAPRPDNYA